VILPRNALIALVLLVGSVVAWPAFASEVITAPEALSRMAKGEITLIDVRSVDEWRDSGIPKGAKPISIHDPGGMDAFVARIAAAVKGDRTRPVALICARGVRSTRADWALSEAGFTNILNVREGTLGNWFDGPGWFDRKLPVEPYDRPDTKK
tara:strand:+ start:917 stop:1375 length:459 start_codon:yes stop_codon:yes gene_type:complete